MWLTGEESLALSAIAKSPGWWFLTKWSPKGGSNGRRLCGAEPLALVSLVELG